jgi:hypothetical protein
MRVIPCCPLPYSDGRFNELLAVRTICCLYHRRPRRLAEGLKRAESRPTGVAQGTAGLGRRPGIRLYAVSPHLRPFDAIAVCSAIAGAP